MPATPKEQPDPSYYAATAYRPENVQPMPAATSWLLTKKMFTKYAYYLPWGHYQGKESPYALLLPSHRPWWTPLFSFLEEPLARLDHERQEYFNFTGVISILFMAIIVFASIILAGNFAFFLGKAYKFNHLNAVLIGGFSVGLPLAFIGLSYFLFPYRWILNRKTGMVTIKHAFMPNRTFPFTHVDAIRIYNYGSSRKMSFLTLRYRYRSKYVWILDKAKAHSSGHIYLHWQFLQRYMDVTQSLPDIPALEPYRHLDPTTAAHDAAAKRPERYWRDMSQEQIQTMANELLENTPNLPTVWPCTLAPFVAGRDPDSDELHPKSKANGGEAAR